MHCIVIVRVRGRLDWDDGSINIRHAAADD